MESNESATAANGDAAPDRPKFVLEAARRLSGSFLWKLQRRFFEQKGVDVWRQNTLPSYMTCNPFIAASYARVVLGWLADWTAAPSRLDPSQPVYILELGSGSGRFGFLFLKKLLDLLSRSGLKDVPFQYIMTDFTEPIVAYWRAHPFLQPFVERGILDFARFDAEHDEEITLVHSGKTLGPEVVKNPVAVLANYVFDTIPQDLFAIHQGQLFESLSVVSSSQPEPDPDDPGLLDRLELSYEHRPVAEPPYEDPDFNRILEEYRERLSATALLFPRAALGCLRNLRKLSGDRLLLISSDKGHSQEAALLFQGPPSLIVHAQGCFSLMVNFHALGRYIVHQGGIALHTPHRHSKLNTSVLALGTPPPGFAGTAQAFHEAVAQFSPDDFYLLREVIEAGAEKTSLEQFLAYLRFSGWDPSVLLSWFPRVIRQLGSIPAALAEELHWSIQNVWDHYFPLGEEQDLALVLGAMLSQLRYYPDALELYHHSVRIYGPSLASLYNIAACHYQLRQLDKALECVEAALQLSPLDEDCRILRLALREALGRKPGTARA